MGCKKSKIHNPRGVKTQKARYTTPKGKSKKIKPLVPKGYKHNKKTGVISKKEGYKGPVKTRSPKQVQKRVTKYQSGTPKTRSKMLAKSSKRFNKKIAQSRNN